MLTLALEVRLDLVCDSPNWLVAQSIAFLRCSSTLSCLSCRWGLLHVLLHCLPNPPPELLGLWLRGDVETLVVRGRGQRGRMLLLR